jgi:hypothetical protein
MENLSAYTILRILGDNPAARNLPVNWAFNDLEEEGWAKRSDFVRLLDQSNRFLIVTEGSSDAAIIRPHICGLLLVTCQAHQKIQNYRLFKFDNDESFGIFV